MSSSSSSAGSSQPMTQYNPSAISAMAPNLHAGQPLLYTNPGGPQQYGYQQAPAPHQQQHGWGR
jgi:hypothetical protein